jgi:hypothetical protein
MMPFQSAETYRHFAESVKHDRRFIYQEDVTGFLHAVEETSVSRTHTLKSGHILWRAQIGSQTRIEDKGEPGEMEVDAPWFEDRMMPNPSKVGDGRANPRGVAYLYLANSAATAGSEMRPWLGALMSISQFETKRDLKIVDCASDKKRWFKGFKADVGLVPWEPHEYESVVWGDIGEAMSRPYDPEELSLNYVPTQIVAERLRNAGVDGMAYKSLLAKDGVNFVLFDVKDADPINFTLYEAKEVAYTISQCDNTYFQPDEDLAL